MIQTRILPQDLEAEQSLLGSMMLSREAVGACMGIIRRDDFVLLANQLLYDALMALWSADEPIDLTTLKAQLTRSGVVADLLPGIAPADQNDQLNDLLVQYVESVPSHLNAAYYARIVAECATRRRFIAAAQFIEARAYDQTIALPELVDEAQAKIMDLATGRTEGDKPATIGEILILEDVFNAIARRQPGAVTGVPTGFQELDGVLSGLQKGEMIVVGARPSQGKTAFGLCIAEYAALVANVRTMLISAEMGRQALVERLLSMRSRVNGQHIRRNLLSAQDLAALRSAAADFEAAPVVIDDRAGPSVADIRAAVRAQRTPVGLVIIDYLQLLWSPHAESRQVQVSEISRQLKAMARSLNIPVVVLAQLNRQPVGEKIRRPQMSDLRESGSLEQDADVVMLIHREEQYFKGDAHAEWAQKNPDKVGMADIIIDKQRNGPTGLVTLAWQAACTRFENAGTGSVQTDQMAVAYARDPSASQPPLIDDGAMDLPF